MLKEKEVVVRRLMKAIEMLVIFAVYWISFFFRTKIHIISEGPCMPP